MSACFCNNIDYPAVGAWAVCDMHWNSQIASERPNRSRREVEASANLDDLVEALNRFAQAVYRTRQTTDAQTPRPQQRPALPSPDGEKNKGRLTAW